jgi:hypothetical protein
MERKVAGMLNKWLQVDLESQFSNLGQEVQLTVF